MKTILFLAQSAEPQEPGDREVVKGHRKTSSSPLPEGGLPRLDIFSQRQRPQD